MSSERVVLTGGTVITCDPTDRVINHGAIAIEGERIVAVGSGARDDSGKIIALDVKAGDRILFGKWSGTEVKLNGEDLLIMKESDIMGILG